MRYFVREEEDVDGEQVFDVVDSTLDDDVAALVSFSNNRKLAELFCNELNRLQANIEDLERGERYCKENH